VKSFSSHTGSNGSANLPFCIPQPNSWSRSTGQTSVHEHGAKSVSLKTLMLEMKTRSSAVSVIADRTACDVRYIATDGFLN